MFDEETAQFFTLLRSNTIGEASSIGLRSILESNIPVNVKTFFRADVEWLRAREKAKETRSAKFSFALPELRLLDEQIDMVLINNFVFTRKDFDATADKCIHFLLNYLCRPEWTLNSFFFDTSIRITAEEMQSKLRYCADYPYYRAILSRYTDTRQRTDVGSEEMKRLLSTIDEEVCGSASPAELASIAKPIFDFVGEIRASMRPPLAARVPVRALIYFFEDKRLSAYAAALSAVRELDNGFHMTFPMLEMVLEAVAKGATVPGLAALSAATVPDEVPEHAAAAPGAEDELPASMMEDEPHREAPIVSLPGSPAGKEDGADVHGDTEAGGGSLVDAHADPETETESDREEAAAVLPPHFTENDRLAITNALFQGRDEMFASAVDTAVNAGNWDDAVTSLDRFFAEQYIDPFTKEAMMFTNILESWHRTLKK